MNIKDELKSDLSFNESNLLEKMQELPVIHSKWASRLVKSNLELKTLNIDLRIMIKKRTDYYSGHIKGQNDKFCPLSLTPQQIRDVYIPGDVEIVEIKKSVSKKEAECEFLEYAMKQVNQVQWIHRNYIEWQKWTTGVN